MPSIRQIFDLLPDKLTHEIWRMRMRSPHFREKFLLDFLPDEPLSNFITARDSSSSRINVLVLHGLRSDSRQTTVDYVSAFLGSSRGVDLTVANVFGFMPEWLGEVSFDLAVVTTEALSYRSAPFWPSLEKRIIRATSSAKKKVLMPQDDYTDSAKLDSLAVKAGVDTIYSPLIRGLDLIYPRATKSGVQFVEALTGYFEQDKVASRSRMSQPFRERTIDIGQRVRKLPPQFGEIGIRKYEIAEVLSDSAAKRGLSVDFSPKPEDVLLGEKWFQFLGETKFTVSCRGGSSIIDAKGKIASRLVNLKKYFPKISEDRAFKIASIGQVKSGDFDAVSPRLFDAAMMGVCQILLEDDYMGMEPWVHYIPLKRDYSNMDEIFEAMASPGVAENIVKNSQEFLLDPKRFSYTSLVELMLAREVGEAEERNQESTLNDVDYEISQVDGASLKSAFMEISSYARAHVTLGRKIAGQIKLDGANFSAREYNALQRWIDVYFKKPAFPEILIVRWCPLSWFLAGNPDEIEKV